MAVVLQSSISVGAKSIGPRHPVFIIAEAGVNHNGDARLARELILRAKRAGADCVKFQTFSAERVASQAAPKARYQLKATMSGESQLTMLKALELDRKVYRQLLEAAKKEGIIFLSTPYDAEDVDFLDELGVPAFKLASIHVVEHAFLRHVAKKQKPVILSTGMATLKETREAVAIFKKAGNKKLILLQCTTDYPSAIKEANLRAMQTISSTFKLMTGYSDHTPGFAAACVAAALGARVVEKHFTVDKNLPGPDQAASLDTAEFTQYVRMIRDAEMALGSAEKNPTPSEQKNAVSMRRSAVAAKDIKAGTILRPEHLALKRPGLGFLGNRMGEILGKRALKNIRRETLITPDLIRRRD